MATYLRTMLYNSTPMRIHGSLDRLLNSFMIGHSLLCRFGIKHENPCGETTDPTIHSFHAFVNVS